MEHFEYQKLQLELQNLLGKELEKVYESENLPRETQIKVLDTAAAISSLAKQMINNADVVLRAEKLETDGKLRNSAIIAMIKGNKE